MREAYRKRWADPEYRKRILTQNAEWDKAHPGDGRKRSLRWRNRNLQKARASEKRWRTRNRDWTQARDHARRAAKAEVTINPRSIQIFINGVRNKKAVICYYCGSVVSGHKAHFDHIVPLSKGGPHSVENLCVSCPRCNQTKLNKPIHEWMRLGQQILSL